MNIENARSVKQCLEIATCDAHGNDEIAAGWLACLQEIFSDVEEFEVLGDIVNFKSFDIVSHAVVARVSRSKKEAKVTLDSLKLIPGTRDQKLWLKAYLQKGIF